MPSSSRPRRGPRSGRRQPWAAWWRTARTSSSGQAEPELLCHQECGRADYDVIAASLAELYARLARDQWQRTCVSLTPDLGQVLQPQVRRRADDQDVVDVECGDHRCDALAEHPRCLENDGVDFVLSAVKRVDQRLVIVHRGHQSVRGANHGAHARDGLETADSPAAAALGVGGLRWTPEDRMAYLSGPRTLALVKLTAEDDARPDPHTDAYHDQVLRPGHRSERALRDGRGLTVVGDHDRHAESFRNYARQRQVRPIQIHSPADDAVA